MARAHAHGTFFADFTRAHTAKMSGRREHAPASMDSLHDDEADGSSPHASEDGDEDASVPATGGAAASVGTPGRPRAAPAVRRRDRGAEDYADEEDEEAAAAADDAEYEAADPVDDVTLSGKKRKRAAKGLESQRLGLNTKIRHARTRAAKNRELALSTTASRERTMETYRTSFQSQWGLKPLEDLTVESVRNKADAATATAGAASSSSNKFTLGVARQVLGCLLQYVQETTTITIAIGEYRTAKAEAEKAKQELEALEREGGRDQVDSMTW